MVIIAHFIDDSWVLQSRILRFIYVPTPHTAEILTDVLYDCLVEWNLVHRIGVLTIDNCTTNDAMVQSLLNRLFGGSLMLGGSFLHMRCCAHIINLIVKHGLDVIGEGIERIRSSVSYWSTTPKRVEKFEEAARQSCITCTKKLCLDCPTRWNSTYLMLVVALEYKDVFPQLKYMDKHYKGVPSDDDWNFSRDVCEKLKLFYQVTELFPGNKYPTSNVYFPKACEIRLNLLKWMMCENDVISKMA